MRSVPLFLLILHSTFAIFAGEISEFNLQNQFIGAAQRAFYAQIGIRTEKFTENCDTHVDECSRWDLSGIDRQPATPKTWQRLSQFQESGAEAYEKAPSEIDNRLEKH
jgi:hypothetical protein